MTDIKSAVPVSGDSAQNDPAAFKKTTSPDTTKPEGSAPTGRAIKYLGMSDIRRLEVGENLLGSQENGLTTIVEWTPQNSHIIHTGDYPDVPDAFWNQLVTYETFADVSNETPESMPKSDWEQIYRPRG